MNGISSGVVKKETVTVVCPACRETVPATAYDGIVRGRCLVTGNQVALVKVGDEWVDKS